MSEPMTSEEVARYVVARAVWAPSVHNTQPWRFTAAGPQISLHADTGRRLAVADPEDVLFPAAGDHAGLR